jgi:hypothetical protein
LDSVALGLGLGFSPHYKYWELFIRAVGKDTFEFSLELQGGRGGSKIKPEDVVLSIGDDGGRKAGLIDAEIAMWRTPRSRLESPSFLNSSPSGLGLAKRLRRG